MGFHSLSKCLLLAAAAVATVRAFGPRHHRPPSTARFQTNDAAAFATDPSERQSIPSSTSTTTSSTSGPPFRLQRIDHVVIRCRDFPSMFDFYHRVLGCTIDEPRDEHANRFGGALTHLRAGSCYVDLLAYDEHYLTEEGAKAAARMHAGGAGLGDDRSFADLALSAESSTLDHLCLRVDSFDRDEMLDYLGRENVEVVTAGDRRLGADGVGPSVYVRDPEGNVIELKGSPYRDDNDEPDAKSTNVRTQRSTDVPGNDDMKQQSEDDDVGEGTNQSDNTQQNHMPPKAATGTPATPCNRICRYNSSFYDGQVCIGCFREAYEIEMWQSMTPDQKSMTLADAIDRCSEASVQGETSGNFDGAVTADDLTRQYEYWTEMANTR